MNKKYKISKKHKLNNLLKNIERNFYYKKNQYVNSLSSYDCAGQANLAFLEKDKIKNINLDEIKASCIIVPKKININKNIVVCKNPRATFEKICRKFIKNYNFEELIDGNKLGFKKCGINVKISKFSKIDKNVIFEDNILVYKNTTISRGCKISSGSIIGNFGLGPYFYKKKNYNCSHLGGVLIGENTYVGANTLIARGTLKDTVIGKNVAIGNLVNIGHNSRIADNCLISSSVSIGGNANIKKNTHIGIGSTICPRIKIGSNCKVGINTNVIKSLSNNQSVFGNPAKKIFFLDKLF